MPSEIIAKYYLLCAVQSGGRRHIVNDAPMIFTKKELAQFFKKRDGVLAPREIVIGGAEEDGRIIVF